MKGKCYMKQCVFENWKCQKIISISATDCDDPLPTKKNRKYVFASETESDSDDTIDLNVDHLSTYSVNLTEIEWN